MGIDHSIATTLVYLKKRNLVQSEITCLGRQEMYVGPKELRRIASDMGTQWSDKLIDDVLAQPFADDFLRACGFDEIHSMDANSFEGADIIHDLNKPLPPQLHGSTSFLYDGGTLEHVFDVATAFKSTFDLLKEGGIVIYSPPANNLCGHGFYQFSPEFFYRLLEANGFDSIKVYLVTAQQSSDWLLAEDPLKLKRRVQFMTSQQLQFVVIARKVRSMPEIVIPQQSDYAQMEWNETPEERVARKMQQFSSKKRMRDTFLFKAVFPLAVFSRNVLGLKLGTGVPGLWLKSWFKPVNPRRDALFAIDGS